MVELGSKCAGAQQALHPSPQGDPFAGEFELYARLDGVYVCGCGEDTRPVSEEPADVAISDRARACLTASAASVRCSRVAELRLADVAQTRRPARLQSSLPHRRR